MAVLITTRRIGAKIFAPPFNVLTDYNKLKVCLMNLNAQGDELLA